MAACAVGGTYVASAPSLLAFCFHSGVAPPFFFALLFPLSLPIVVGLFLTHEVVCGGLQRGLVGVMELHPSTDQVVKLTSTAASM